MKKAFDLVKLVSFRRTMHQHPESSLQEFETTRRIREFLLSVGVAESQITPLHPTGLIVDIRGQAKAGPDQPPKIVLFRADIDALEMKEVNPAIDYQSVNHCAHMCGHDGHTTCLLGGLSLLLETVHEMPESRVARFVFQPAEEKFGGARLMVEAGCLEGVAEAWGLHNVPFDPPGKLLVKGGPVTSDVQAFKITVTGRGGHSSLKSQLNNPLLPACELNLAFEALLENEFKAHVDKEIIFVAPAIFGNFASNVIAKSVRLEGTLRVFDLGVKERFLGRMREEMARVAAKFGVEVKYEIETSYSMIQNDPKLAQEFAELMGETSEERLPFKFSEDFSEYSKRVPSCFFFLCAGRQAGETLHANNYNFNEELIESTSRVWLKLARDRLQF